MFRLLILFLLSSLIVNGQDTIISSSLKEVVITSYFKPEEQFYQPVSTVVIDSLQLKNSRDQTLIPLVNQKAGVRMEERSPGSFRFSIRGSLLRSPFGIRNVKFYMNEFPLTDAGGNTYFNLFDHTAFDGIEIIKGPDGSIFGANSGGVTRLLTNAHTDTLALNVRLNSGSFGEVYESVKEDLILGKHNLSVFESYRRNDGYRMNSGLKKFNVLLHDALFISQKISVDAFAFAGNLNYATPGGLTQTQAETDPRQSRPATAFLPSAIEQKAGIENMTGWFGAKINYKINQRLTYVASVSSMLTEFSNPFITNYEKRNETGVNGRTWLMIENINSSRLRYKFVAGAEGSVLNSQINNYENLMGNSGQEIVSDRIKNKYLILFGSMTFYLGNKLTGQISLSENINSISVQNTFPSDTLMNRKYKDQLMPKYALSYSPYNFVVLRAVISKGYSIPTTAEIRPSGNILNTFLQPETGWNYEAGLRFKTLNKFFLTDISLFKYSLSNTITRRTDDLDREYFINSGETSQKGIEVQTSFNFPVSANGRIEININNAITLYDFRFEKFISGETDLSGKKLTGVPDKTISSGFEIRNRSNWSVSCFHYFTDKIPLNDLTTDQASEVHLFNLKAEKYFKAGKSLYTIFVQIENLTDEYYSSGYDLNAFGGRYYNPSPGRTFTAGISLEFTK